MELEVTMQQLFQQTTQGVVQLQKNLELLQQRMDMVVEENNRLRIKNSQLENLVDYLARDTPPNVEKSVPSTIMPEDAKAQLKKFYDEGIHICHPFYGSKRTLGEECMFCQEVLHGSRDGH